MISRQRDVPGTVSPGPLSRRALDRLPVYLRRLTVLAAAATEYVSSDQLAAAAGASRDLVRKDLSALGQLGRPGKGYPVVVLKTAIEQILGISTHQPVILVGAGYLGTALVQYGGFAARGLDVVSVLDADPARVGQDCGELTIEDMGRADAVIDRTGARLAILTVPGDAAQQVCFELVRHGIRGILNFAPVELDVPEDVTVRVVDVSAELQLLAFHQISGAADSER